MVSTVKTRPNHYEILGLRPAASDEEIAQAFAARMRLPHRASDIAQIGIAFDTLRNQAKRRAYDQSLGLAAEAPPRYVSGVTGYRVSARLAGSVPPDLPRPKATVSPQSPMLQPSPRPKQEASLRSSPDPFIQSELSRETPRPEPEIPDFLAVARARMERSRDPDERVIDWKQPILALGSVLLVVVLIGAWAGAHVQDAGEPQQVEPARSTTLPVPDPSQAAPPVAETSRAVKPEPRPAGTFSAPPDRITGNQSRPQAERREDRLAQISQSVAIVPERSPAADGTTEEAAADTAQAPAVAASLPLPNAIVARTIRRLGYACAQVASSAPVEGEATGVFKITCTSGQSYHAAPVRGRYHFRRWGRN
jgi:hypothetical protein